MTGIPVEIVPDAEPAAIVSTLLLLGVALWFWIGSVSNRRAARQAAAPQVLGAGFAASVQATDVIGRQPKQGRKRA